jgi:hypothetical protein
VNANGKGYIIASNFTKESYIITNNVPVVFVARYIMVLRSATSLLRALERVGPEKRDFFGPKWHSQKNHEV